MRFFNYFSAAIVVSLGFVPGSPAAYLSEAQQLQMYRECRVTYSDKDKYFAKKMCGCLVQAYMHDVPPEHSAPKCMKYAMNNPY